MNNDTELLRRYVEDHSEPAFADLVREHVNLVYSAALRETYGDTGLAEDLSQAVFTKMAADARRLISHPCLSGWLYTAVRNLAANERRAEHRRRHREQEAFSMNELLSEDSPESTWRQIRPMLDEALHALNESDRTALVLRFLEERPLREVGSRLGLTENAARMRVDRALEKLRDLLAHRGITSTATGLAAAIAAGVVTPAPAALVSTITAAAVSSAVVSTSSTITLLKCITMSKAQAGLIGLLLCTSVALPIWQQTRISRAETDNTQLKQRITELTAQPEASAQAGKELEDLRQWKTNASGELARLRGMTGVARRAEAEVADLRAKLAKQMTDANKSGSPQNLMANAMANAMEQRVTGQIARMTEKLHLTPQQAQSANEILSRQARLATAGVQQVFSGKINKDELTKLGKDAGNTDEQIKALLTEDQRSLYQGYKDDENAQDARLNANNELIQMQSTLNLTPGQQDQVFQILYEVTFNQISGRAGTSPASTSPVDQTQWIFDQKNKALEPILTPSQMETYRQQQEVQLKLVKDIAAKLNPGK